jgi:hypothetical protein
LIASGVFISNMAPMALVVRAARRFGIFCLLSLPLLSPGADQPAAPAEVTAKPVEKSGWVFSILPKSFQKNPNIDLTVITEMTPEGKKLPPVTPAHPAFYRLQSAGRHQVGEKIHLGTPMPESEVERLLVTALAANGYRRAEEGGEPPTLGIFYVWGMHSLPRETDPDNPVLTANQITANLLDRARIVGGEKFAHNMLQLFHDADDQYVAAGLASNTAAAAPVGRQGMFLNPVQMFARRSDKNEFLVEQSSDDIYYIVASAYDYRELTLKQRKLLWRTSMTVGADGVSEEQTLPTLAATAAPFFGKEMPEAATFTKRSVPEGQVEIGTPTVVAPAKPGATPEKK